MTDTKFEEVLCGDAPEVQEEEDEGHSEEVRPESANHQTAKVLPTKSWMMMMRMTRMMMMTT